MMIAASDFMEYDLTFLLLLVCFVIFVYLAAKSRNVRSFQFQISVFIIIWMMGELANVLLENGVISVPSYAAEIGYEVHLGSMIFFGVFLYGRYYFSSKRGRKLIENVDIEDYHPVTPEEFGEGSSSEKKS